jgi:hypothetical protein
MPPITARRTAKPRTAIPAIRPFERGFGGEDGVDEDEGEIEVEGEAVADVGGFGEDVGVPLVQFDWQPFSTRQL